MKNINTAFWLVIDATYGFVSSINLVLLNFFLWEQDNSLTTILEFNFYIFVGLMISALLAGYVSSWLSPKITYIISIAALVATNFFALQHLADLSNYLLIVAILYSFSVAFVYNARSVINILIIPAADFVKIRGTKNIISSVLAISSPLVVLFLVNTLGYESSLQLMALIVSILGVIFIWLKVQKTKQKAEFIEMIVSAIYDPRMRKFALINFALGASWAFGWGILNVIIVEKLGSLEAWSKITLIASIAGVFLISLLRNIDSKNKGKTKSFIIGASIIYAIAPLILLFNFTLTTFVIFIFAKLIYDKVNGILTFSYLTDMTRQDEDYEYKKVSYQVVINFYNAVGSLVPIMILLALPAEKLSADILVLVLAIISFLPILMGRLYSTRMKRF